MCGHVSIHLAAFSAQLRYAASGGRATTDFERGAKGLIPQPLLH